MKNYLLLVTVVLGFTAGCGGETTTTTIGTTPGTATRVQVQNLVDPYNKLAACLGVPIAGAIDGTVTQAMVDTMNTNCTPTEFQAIENYLTSALAACEAGGASSVASVPKPTLSTVCKGVAGAGATGSSTWTASEGDLITLQDLTKLGGGFGVLADCAGAKPVSTLFVSDIAQSDVDAVNAACTKADYNLGVVAVKNAVDICLRKGAAGVESLQPPAFSATCVAHFRFGPAETTTDGPNASAAATTLRLGLAALDKAQANLATYTVADFVVSPRGASLVNGDVALRQQWFFVYTQAVGAVLYYNRAAYNSELTYLDNNTNYKVHNTKGIINEELAILVEGDLLTTADLLP